jgi:hypothetical protein
MKSTSPVWQETVEKKLSDLYMRRDVISNLIRCLEDYSHYCRPAAKAGPPLSRHRLTEKLAS